MNGQMNQFSFSRWWSIVRKEFIQLKRDRPTFAMIVGIPIMQLFLFGFAINSDPKHLPAAIVSADDSVFTRSFISAMQNTDYFTFKDGVMNERDAEMAMAQGKVLFVVSIPPDFTRKLLRGEHPSLLVESDTTDPVAAGNAMAAVSGLAAVALQKDARGAIPAFNTNVQPPFTVQLHRRYNPEGITQYNIIPGLMGVVLTMTLVMMTGLSITRERERGTLENLLAMPVKPIEVMSGKIVPYIFIGLIQSTIIVLAARYIYHVPFLGSVTVLFVMILLFISCNLVVGITLSSFARNQMQAMQMTQFFFLPSLMLSGFMFPFQGMPVWAQTIGSFVPLTYFMRVVRGIMLKGNGWEELWPNIWPLLIMNIVVLFIGIKFYRRTLD
jgi:ABC-2 type transport system permease protein